MRHLHKRELESALQHARQYTNALLDDLPDPALQVPLLPIVNPLLWEWGHVGWFQEYWCVRGAGRGAPAPSMLERADSLYDSSRVAHDTRWSLDLPSRAATREYMARVLDATLDALARADDDDAGLYFFRLALYHEDMHGEAFAYMRHTLGMPPPAGATPPADVQRRGDVALPATTFPLGAPRDGAGFVFDNEKWSHDVAIEAFSIAAAPVTQREFADFVADGGYTRDELWSDAGLAWRRAANAQQPRDWRDDGGAWLVRSYDRWAPLREDAPIVHVNAFEAEAWCRWAGRRLPTEAEWEYAATSGAIAPAGVWEWTSTPFAPYPGFSADPYRDYSAPWFHTHRVARGASHVTPARLVHPRFRNFYLPARNDFFVGFRTCAL